MFILFITFILDTTTVSGPLTSKMVIFRLVLNSDIFFRGAFYKQYKMAICLNKYRSAINNYTFVLNIYNFVDIPNCIKNV